MILTAIIGWALAGAVAATCLIAFWDNIREWLNNTAANAVERVLGYGAKKKMHRAVAKINRVMDKIKNQTIVYIKKNELDTTFNKVTMESEASILKIDSDVLKEIDKAGTLVQEFKYEQ